MKLFVVFNPNAGKSALKSINQALDLFEEQGHEVTLFFSKKRGGTRVLTREIAAKKPDCVVAAGGDGTINEVMDGLVGSAIPLGIIPFGTANTFALEAGIPLHTAAACSIIQGGNVRKISVGKANNRHFMMLASVGFDAEVIYRLSQHLRQNPGKTAYYFEALKGLLTFQTPAFTVQMDGGQTFTCHGLLVSNTKAYGGRVLVSPQEQQPRPALEVCLFLKPGPIQKLRAVFSRMFLKRGEHMDKEGCIFRRCTSLTIDTGKTPQHVQADGDIVTQTPCRIEVVPDALSVVLPAPGFQAPEGARDPQDAPPHRSRRRRRYRGPRDSRPPLPGQSQQPSGRGGDAPPPPSAPPPAPAH